MKILVVVDMQNDFVDGALGTAEARAIVNKVADEIRARADKDTVLVLTQDTHNADYMETQEGKNLPVPHCIYNTWGWELAPAIAEAVYDAQEAYHPLDHYFPYMANHTIVKPTFGSVDFQNLLYALDNCDEPGVEGEVEEITFMGLCTGICVISNAMLAKATLTEAKVNVIADCCACVTPDSHKTALEAMKLCQINIV